MYKHTVLNICSRLGLKFFCFVFFLRSYNRTLGGSHYILCSIFISSLSCQLFSILGRKNEAFQAAFNPQEKTVKPVLLQDGNKQPVATNSRCYVKKINFVWLTKSIKFITDIANRWFLNSGLHMNCTNCAMCFCVTVKLINTLLHCCVQC